MDGDEAPQRCRVEMLDYTWARLRLQRADTDDQAHIRSILKRAIDNGRITEDDTMEIIAYDEDKPHGDPVPNGSSLSSGIDRSSTAPPTAHSTATPMDGAANRATAAEAAVDQAAADDDAACKAPPSPTSATQTAPAVDEEACI